MTQNVQKNLNKKKKKKNIGHTLVYFGLILGKFWSNDTALGSLLCTFPIQIESESFQTVNPCLWLPTLTISFLGCWNYSALYNS